jgi:hypothetical protein
MMEATIKQERGILTITVGQAQQIIAADDLPQIIAGMQGRGSLRIWTKGLDADALTAALTAAHLSSFQAAQATSRGYLDF